MSFINLKKALDDLEIERSISGHWRLNYQKTKALLDKALSELQEMSHAIQEAEANLATSEYNRVSQIQIVMDVCRKELDEMRSYNNRLAVQLMWSERRRSGTVLS